MANRYVTHLFFVLSLCALPFAGNSQQQSPLDSAYRANPNARQLDSLQRTVYFADEQRTQDPALKRVPTERLDAVAAQLAKPRPGGTSSAGVPNLTWTERGPYGIGAKILTHLVDPNDPGQKKVWAGSQYGGLWYTTDITDANAGWRPVSDTWENRNVSTLTADLTNPQVMYAGTGEMIVDYYKQQGGGIWKTTNGGATWQRLSSTIPSAANTLQGAFYGISKLIVNASGHLYAATLKGVIRSTDGGDSWTFVLAPQQSIGGSPVSNGEDGMSDLELGSDGILYAATRMGRLFRAANTAGTVWTEITPPNTSPYNNLRTELGLAPTTSGAGQVVYAVGVFYNSTNYYKDIKWFLKSTDAGASWTAMTRLKQPYSPSDDRDFTNGQGVSTLFMTTYAADPNDLYVGGPYSLHHTLDGGQTWETFYFDRITTFSIRPQGAIWYSVNYGMNQTVLPLTYSSYYTAENRRNKGFGAVPVNSAAMRPVPGTSAFLAMVDERGIHEQTQLNTAESPMIGDAPGQNVFNDQNEPGIQLGVGYYGGVNYRNQSTSTYANMYSLYLPGNSYYYNAASDYESRTNTLYTWNNGYYKFTGVGGSNGNVSLWSGLALGQPSCIRVGAEDNTLYVAVMPYVNNSLVPQLYRITNAASSSPGISRIDGGAFPAGTTISHIEVGRTDNQLLVTLSNYGVPSVWYTTNVGASWTSKDLPAHGLPDVPVYGAVFNPADNRQVMLATQLGVWSTTDITAENPGWEVGNTGMPLIRINQLRVRPSDGRVLASTYGRGVWETSAWAVPHTPPQLTVGPLSATGVCAGSTITVNFSLSGGSNNQYIVRLSDATGSFTNSRTIGNATGSPATVTLPYDVPYGTQYRIQVEAIELSITSLASSPFTINTINQLGGKIMDRRSLYSGYGKNNSYGYGTICSGNTAVLTARDNSGNPFRPTATVRWTVNGSTITGQQATTLAATAAGIYNFTVTEAGCSVTNGYNYELALATSLNSSLVYDYSNTGPFCTGTTTIIGTGTLGESATYQWYKDGAAIAGATSLTYAVAESGSYAYSAQEGSCSITRSGAIPLAFSTAIYAPQLYSSGGPFPVICNGSGVYLSATNTTYNTTYQWLKDNVPITGSTGTYIYASVPAAYTLQIQRGACTAMADPVVVGAASQLTNTVRFMGSTTLCAGTTKYLESVVTNTSYQWVKDGTDIAGATNSYYYAASSGAYTVRVGSGNCTTTAPPVTLTFGNQVESRLSTYNFCTSIQINNRDYVNLSPTRYDWYKDGVFYQSNTYGSLYTTQSGTYSFSATYGTSCTGRSNTYRFVAGAQPAPTIVATSSTQRCADNAVKLTNSTGNFTYWKRDGTRIPFSTNYYADYYPTQSGRYTAVYEQEGCYSESNPIDVVIGEPVTARLTGNAVVAAGQAGTLTVGFTGVAPWSLTLSTGQIVRAITQNPYSLTLAPAATTDYTLRSVRNQCGVGQASGSARITIGSGLADLTLRSVVDRRTPGVGEVVNLSFIVTNTGPQQAAGVRLTDRLPSGLTFIDGSPGWQVSGSNLTFDLGNVANGEERTVTLRARVDAEGVYINATEIGDSQTPDPDSQPGSGTGDGQDDASQVDFRTLNANGTPVVSPNPNQQLLPAVQSNQPTPVADQADLSLQLMSSIRQAKLKETVALTARVSNEGGRSATGIRIDVFFPNGSYLDATGNWVLLDAPTVVPYYLNELASGSTAAVLIYWRPLASGQILAEIGRSDVPDPDSTPGNRTTRPGEDDEASLTVQIP